MKRTSEYHELPPEARIATEREPLPPTAEHYLRIAFGGVLIGLTSSAVAVLVSSGLEGWATNTVPPDWLIWVVFVAVACGVTGVALLASTAPRYCAACGEELPRDAGPWQTLCDECGGG